VLSLMIIVYIDGKMEVLKMKCKHRFQPKRIKMILNNGLGNGMIYVCTVQCVDCGKRTYLPRKYLKSPLSCYLEKD